MGPHTTARLQCPEQKEKIRPFAIFLSVYFSVQNSFAKADAAQHLLLEFRL
jgi:hypothetical protein